MTSQALRGVRVLELGQIIAGTYGGQLLSDLGAEVIKIESPEGDLGRNPSVAPYHGHSGLFLTFNRNKKSAVIDLKCEGGRTVFYDLVRVSDIVVDNFRSGVLERLEIDYPRLSTINPRLIQCSITGFGSDGAYCDLPAFDLMVQAMSGHVAITGEPGRPPVRLGIPLADLSGGGFACKGMLAALFERERTGRGQRVEISMYDAMLHLLTYTATMWLTNGELPKPIGTAHEYMVPWQAFETSDGYIVIATREESFWCRLCEVIGEPGLARDPQFATNALRVENRALLLPRLEEIIRRRTVDEWLKDFRAVRVPAAAVNNLDRAFAEPPVAERGMIVEYEHPEAGRVRVPGNPIRMSGIPANAAAPAPLLGEHTDDVLSEVLRLSPARITQLRADGAIR
jgi:CoA:oxalate CoA-transferase